MTQLEKQRFPLRRDCTGWKSWHLKWRRRCLRGKGSTQ